MYTLHIYIYIYIYIYKYKFIHIYTYIYLFICICICICICIYKYIRLFGRPWLSSKSPQTTSWPKMMVRNIYFHTWILICRWHRIWTLTLALKFLISQNFVFKDQESVSEIDQNCENQIIAGPGAMLSTPSLWGHAPPHYQDGCWPGFLLQWKWITKSLHIAIHTCVYKYIYVYIDWCCFYYFLRNSLVALNEALFARINICIYICIYIYIYIYICIHIYTYL